MSEIYRRRREALAAALGQDAALITRLVNVRYLTGLAASNAAVLVYTDDRDPVLCTDGRYSGTAARICADLEIVVDRDVAAALTERAEKDGVRRLGFEGHDLTWERYQELYGSRRGLEAVPLGRTVEELRMVKDEEEITLLRRACSIGDRALAAVLPLIEPGMTERQIAVQLERNMIDLGADGIA